MTARQVYEAMLIEMNKTEAPSMLLEDFNYLINKAIYQFINKNYNIYDVNQQTTDNLRVLKATAILTPKSGENAYKESGINSLYGGVEEFMLPYDYLHMLNCVCNFKVDQNFKCYNKGDEVQFAARRLTSDIWSQVINNFYMRPMYRRPYYYIHNVNTSTDVPTNPINSVIEPLNSNTYGTDTAKNFNGPTVTIYVMKYKINGIDYQGEESDDFEIHDFMKSHENASILETKTIVSNNSGESQINLPNTINLAGIGNKSLIEKETGVRYGNATPVRLEIRYGKDKSVFKLDKIYVDYIKTPQHIRLTQEQLDLTMDTSQIMEFPDYVCQEIINELVKLMLENASDPRLQTNIPINQTIASPVPQGQQ